MNNNASYFNCLYSFVILLKFIHIGGCPAKREESSGIVLKSLRYLLLNKALLSLNQPLLMNRTTPHLIPMQGHTFYPHHLQSPSPLSPPPLPPSPLSHNTHSSHRNTLLLYSRGVWLALPPCYQEMLSTLLFPKTTKVDR